MWILIVLQLTAGSATAHNSFPIVYSGVTMQQFESKETCEQAKNVIKKMNGKRNDGDSVYTIRSGILEMSCVQN